MTCRCVAPVDVTLYRISTSAVLRQTIQFFERKGVRREDMGVTADPAALQQMEALSGQTERPVMVVDGQVVVGFDPLVLDPIFPSRF